MSTDEQVREELKNLKKVYYDARHHCYAFRLGVNHDKYRAFDDGEPHHSAGEPILGQIRSKDLTDILVVVVRYFGGIQLGISGLTAAYRLAAKDALDQSSIIERDVVRQLALTFDYTETPEVMKLIKEFDLKILHQEFDLAGQMQLEAKLRVYDAFITKLHLLQALGKKITFPKT